MTKLNLREAEERARLLDTPASTRSEQKDAQTILALAARRAEAGSPSRTRLSVREDDAG